MQDLEASLHEQAGTSMSPEDPGTQDRIGSARDRAAAAREAAADRRDRLAEQRDADAAHRDAELRLILMRALQRDCQAERRDRAAEARDAAAEERVGPNCGVADVAAARDRYASACDRFEAGVHRDLSAGDRADLLALLESHASRRTLAGDARQDAALDRGQAASDRCGSRASPHRRSAR